MKLDKAKYVLGTLVPASLVPVSLVPAGLILAALAMPALAADPSGWYLGASVGQSRADIAEREIRDDLDALGFTVTSFRDDEQDVGYKLLGGYRFSRHIAVEGGVFDLGKFDYTATVDPPGSLQGELKFRGVNLDLVGMLPVSERASLFARVGAHHGKARAHFAGSGAVNVPEPRESKTGTDYKMGVGVQYSVTEALALRVEAERYRLDDAVGNKGDIDLYSAGFVYYFAGPAGRSSSPASSTQSAAPERTPTERTLVVAPLPGATQEYCSLLDIQFEVAQADIQREEREKLAVVATYLKRYPKTSAVIEGHSDNVGHAADNLTLSRQRAESVVDYLVREHRIERTRLRAAGYGDTRPVADNRTEAGKRANRRIAAIIGCVTDIAGLEPLPARVTLAMQIDFDTDSATIKPQYRNELRSVAQFLAANPAVTATMEGHADNSSRNMAQRISQERAQSVANYLVEEFGADRSRLRAQGFGDTRRFAYNTSAEGRQENRRVNIILGYPK